MPSCPVQRLGPRPVRGGRAQIDSQSGNGLHIKPNFALLSGVAINWQEANGAWVIPNSASWAITKDEGQDGNSVYVIASSCPLSHKEYYYLKKVYELS